MRLYGEMHWVLPAKVSIPQQEQRPVRDRLVAEMQARTCHESQNKPIYVIGDVMESPPVARGRPDVISQPLRPAAACFLFALSIGLAACGGGGQGPGPTPIQPPPPPPPNHAPVIRSIEAEQPRLEVGASTKFTAVVEDVETAAENLQYDWTAEVGTFSGEGSNVTWQAPAEIAEPINPVVTLTVLEAYAVNGVQQTNRSVLTSSTVRVHNSQAELTELVDSFLHDFEDSSVSASRCVRNFSDSCRGKQAELEDIERNRRDYVMLPASRHSIRAVTIIQPWARAEMRASCTFVSKIKATGQTGTASGSCLLTGVYENDRWWLCDSRFTGTTTNPLFFIR